MVVALTLLLVLLLLLTRLEGNSGNAKGWVPLGWLISVQSGIVVIFIRVGGVTCSHGCPLLTTKQLVSLLLHLRQGYVP